MGPSGSQPIPATPVVSDVIFDRKSHGDLNIVDFSPNWSLTRGGTKILILCEKVSSKDIEVRFEYTDKRGERRIVIGNIAKQGIHKQCGISLETPKLPSQNLNEKIKVIYILLYVESIG
jgi:Rel/ankyrin family protein